MSDASFEDQLERIRPSHEWAVKATFVQFSQDSLKKDTFLSKYEAMPDDIPSSSLDEVTRDIVMMYKDRAEWAKQFEEKYGVPMHTYHNYFVRLIKWVGGIQKGYKGWGADTATVARAKQELRGNYPLSGKEGNA